MTRKVTLPIFNDLAIAFSALQLVQEKIELVEADVRVAAQARNPGQADLERYQARFLADNFPRMVRYSAIMHAHAAADAILLKLCDHVQATLSLPFGRLDMRDRGALSGSVKYLKKALGAFLPDDVFDSEFWHKLRDFSEVRNCIAHAWGDLNVGSPDKAAHVREAAKRLGMGDSGTHLEISSEASAAMLREADDLIATVCLAVRDALTLRRDSN